MLSDWSPTAQNSPFPFNITKHTKNFIKSHSVAFRIPFHPYCNSHLFLDLSKCMYVCIYFYIIQYCSKVWGHFFFINTFIQHGHLDIFSRHLECYKRNRFQICSVALNFEVIKESWKKYHGFHKNIKQKKKFNMVLEHQISILEWFLKNHVTLMIRVMMLKMQLQEEITYSNIFKWKSSDLVVTIFPISQFYRFFIV